MWMERAWRRAVVHAPAYRTPHLPEGDGALATIALGNVAERPDQTAFEVAS